MQFNDYEPGNFYDELFVAQGEPRPDAMPLVNRIDSLSREEVQRRQAAAQIALFKMGVTFNVYSDDQGTERIIPFDIIPRIVSADDWATLEKGLEQRIYALNLFLADIYSDQKILRDNVIPSEIIYSASGFLKPCMGLKPPGG
ncbi:MAG TPA: circularly permuted type 2 ATP-grasp protein, partial [Thermosynechococcaceae cyanobacterium]